MVSHVNFYENIKEARLRLSGSVVLYDGEPYHVLTMTDGHGDDIIRLYMEAVGTENLVGSSMWPVPFPYDAPYEAIDDWIAKNPKANIIRKMMNSPKFNRFRPFPLGMCNVDGKVIHLERHPVRTGSQGLTQSMIYHRLLSLNGVKSHAGRSVGLLSPELKSCIKGDYPPFFTCVDMLKNPDVVNEGIGFCRDFALLRGPIQTLYLAYKHDVIGLLPNGDNTVVKIGKDFEHTKEVVQTLGIFSNISVN